jgi:WD40 repeat protein
MPARFLIEDEQPGAVDGRVYLIDAEGGGVRKQWRCGNAFFSVLAVSRMHAVAALGAAGGKVWFVPLDEDRAPEAAEAHRGTVYAIAISPGGKRLVSGGTDGSARLYDIRSRRELLVFFGHRSMVTGAAFSPDGRPIVTVSREGLALGWTYGR